MAARVTQHLPWFTTVVQHTTDTPIDDAGEMTVFSDENRDADDGV